MNFRKIYNQLPIWAGLRNKMEKQHYIMDKWGYCIDNLVNTEVDENGFTYYVSPDGREYYHHQGHWISDLEGMSVTQWNCQCAQGKGINHCQCGMCK